MGELSKKVGEIGESIVLTFLNMIGWTEDRIINGVDLPCNSKEDHKLPTSKGERNSHGIDLLFSYMCPYDPTCKKQVLISVKHTAKDEKAKRTDATVRQDLVDVESALSCYQDSELRALQMQSSDGTTRTQDVGLIFYLDMTEEGVTYSDVKISSNPIKSGGRYFLSILDSARFDFIEACHHHLKLTYPKHSFSYYTPCQTPIPHRNTSPIMPYSWISGGELLFAGNSYDEGGKEVRTLYVFCEQEFDKDELTNLVSLALSISADWVSALILFPNYNTVRHEEVAKAIIQSIPHSKESPIIMCGSYEKKT